MSYLSFTKDQEDIFNNLKKEIFEISLKWQIYRQLFGSSPENTDVLFTCAEECFAVLMYALYSDIHISITRLLEQQTTGSNKNLSLERLMYIIKDIDIYLYN